MKGDDNGLHGHRDAFASDYALARSLFLSAALEAGATIESRVLPMTGLQGEELALDLACVGPSHAERVLVISSGCHGVEGFCGSGIQVAALTKGDLARRAEDAGVSVWLMHALNPFGFSHLRRVTQENVDLNRNFQDFSHPAPENPGYDRVHDLLLPAEWPPTTDNEQALADFIDGHGHATFKAAVSSGQYTHPDGMFFGGRAPTWSRLALEAALAKRMQLVRNLSWLDIHTGLGPSGVLERIHTGPAGAGSIQRAKAWWGDEGRTPITSTDDGSSSSAPLTGLMVPALASLWPHVVWTSLALEYGTRPFDDVLQALRADHWLYQHHGVSSDLRAQIRKQLRDAFYVDTDAWRGQVVTQALTVFAQGMEGLRRT
jgi:hypothetical protein